MIAWLARNEIARLNQEHAVELNAVKTLLATYERTTEAQIKELEELEKKITGLEAVIAYAKDLHDQMFGIIKSFAPRQYPEPSSQVGGIKSWNSIRKELEKKNVESGPKV